MYIFCLLIFALICSAFLIGLFGLVLNWISSHITITLRSEGSDRIHQTQRIAQKD